MKRSGINRKTPLEPSGSLAPVSKRRQRENRERKKVLKDMLDGNESVPCFVEGCTADANDGHELLSRARGGSITDPANIRPVCRWHHNRITTEPAWAEEQGYALPSPPRRAS